MNFIVVRPDGTWHIRPDTTAEREMGDFYLPESFGKAVSAEGVWVRVVKAGKGIQPRFADRYLDGRVGKAVVIYGDDGQTCIDGSTYLLAGEEVPSEKLRTSLVEALCRITSVMTVRTGDIIIIEEDKRKITRRGETLSGLISLH